MNKRNHKKAFTLVEMVIVIAVIGILSAILIPTFGKVFENSAISNDSVTLRSLNTSIALYLTDGNKIKDDQDIKKALDTKNSEGFFDSLRPTSAKYGYHYWWDANTEQIVLAKADGLSPDEIIYAPAEEIEKTRKKRAKTTAVDTSFFSAILKITGGYFLLEQSGCTLAETISTLAKADMTAEDYAKVVKNAKNLADDEHDGALSNNLQELLRTTAFLSNNGTFRHENAENVKNVVFNRNLTTVVNNLTTHNDDGNLSQSAFSSTDKVATVSANGENKPLLILPSTVNTIGTNALNFGEDAQIRVSKKEDELTTIFTTSATNSTIVIPESSATYKIVNDKIVKTVEDVTTELDGSLEYSNTVKDFALYLNGNKANPNYFYSVDNLPEKFEFSADNFVGVKENESIPDTSILWSTDNENAKIENGVLTFVDPHSITADTVTVTAKALCVAQGETVEKEIKLNLVRIVGFNLNVTEIDEELLFGDTFSTAISASGFSYNYPSAVEKDQCDTTLNFKSNDEKVCAVDENGNLAFKGFGSTTVDVTLASNPSKIQTIKVAFTEIVTDVLVKKFDENFLYRVGNGNEFNLSYLFGVKDGVNLDGITYTVNVYDASLTDGEGKLNSISANSGDYFRGSASVIENLTDFNTNYRFYGTGVAIVQVQAIKNEKAFQTVNTAVEVVDGKNAVQYSDISGHGSNSVVMLCDVTMPKGDYQVAFSNCNFYGNGFTFDVSGGRTKGQYRTTNYLVSIINGVLDNINIVGAVYTNFGTTASENYNNALVFVGGNSVIANAILSNCACPVRVDDADAIVTIKNTVLRGGCFANMDIRGGQITLENVTTVNNAEDNDKSTDGKTIVGLGITVYYENVAPNTTITIKDNLTQYNSINKSDKNNIVKNDYTNLIFEKIFSVTDFVYDSQWINTGIISLDTNNFTGDNLILTEQTNKNSYKQQTKELSYVTLKKDIFLYLPTPTAPTYHNNAPHTMNYEFIAPSFEMDFSSQLIEKVDGALKYLTIDEDGNLHAGVSENNNVTIDFESAVICKKYGNELVVNASLSNKTYTPDDLGQYDITFSVDDVYFYDLNGKTITNSLQYVKTITVFVEVLTWKNAEISVVPGTVYWEKAGSSWDPDYYSCIPIATGITITDYSQSGEPSTIVSDGATLPTNLSYEFTVNSSPVFSTSPEEIKNNGILYIKSSKAANNKQTSNYTIKFSYPGNNGITVTTTASYSFTKETPDLPPENSDGGNGDGSGCVTPDTLITLADGSQVEVQNLKGDEELLVWNMFTGNFDKAPILFVDVEEEKLFEVIHLTFSDGTVVKVISEHGFYDFDLNRYVYLDRNASEYIGHWFDKSGERIQLVKVDLINELETAWSPVTYGHLCYYVNGMLSMPGGIDGMFNIFEVDQSAMKYDEELMQKDIEKYGLFTYEEFLSVAEIPEIMFDALGGQYLKVAIGKGLISADYIQALANRYTSFFEK